MLRLRCALLGAVVLAPGCLRIAPYSCEDASQCVRGGEAGRCEPDGRCSFMDPSCLSGWAYAPASGGAGETCVPGEGTSSGASSSGPPGEADTGSSTSSTMGSSTEVTTGQTTGESTSTSEGTSSTGEPQPIEPCPEDPPESYILCEDFEGAFDASDYFDWQSDGADAFGVCTDDPNSGARALCVDHPADELDGVGKIVFAFGTQQVGGLVHRPDEQFDEVWLRFSLLLREPWPGNSPGLGDFLNVESRRANMSPALVAAVSLPGQFDEPRPELSAFRCPVGIDYCEWDGADSAVLLGAEPTMIDMFDPSRAGQWACIELHADLGSLGVPDGLAEVYVDGLLEGQLDGLLLLQGDASAGINRVEFGTSWLGADADPDAREWALDDIIVSSEREPCPMR